MSLTITVSVVVALVVTVAVVVVAAAVSALVVAVAAAAVAVAVAVAVTVALSMLLIIRTVKVVMSELDVAYSVLVRVLVVVVGGTVWGETGVTLLLLTRVHGYGTFGLVQ